MGGAYGTGHRVPLARVRAMVTAALAGQLNAVEFTPCPVFGVQVPGAVPGVPSEILDPRRT
ncbi:MAG: phosphoenolpyruvate carboxykinase (ATP) [Janthinobacterium lividum]